jgi:hypothetical protein
MLLEVSPSAAGAPTTLADYKDILAYLITVVGIIVAFLSVFASYILGRKYVEHVDELKFISDKYETVQKLYEDSQRTSKSTLQRLTQGLNLVVGLLVLNQRLEEMRVALELLTEKGVWLGRQLGDRSQKQYQERLLLQIAKSRQQYKARQLELFCLSSEYAYRGGYLRALVEADGDEQTLSFLQHFADSTTDAAARDVYITLMGELSHRLRSKLRTPDSLVDSTLWTGQASSN